MIDVLLRIETSLSDTVAAFGLSAYVPTTISVGSAYFSHDVSIHYLATPPTDFVGGSETLNVLIIRAISAAAVTFFDGKFGATALSAAQARRDALITIEPAGGYNEADNPSVLSADRTTITIDSKSLTMSCDQLDHALTTPVAGIYRFELEQGDQGYDSDPAGVRHRTEIVNYATQFNDGDDVWWAYSVLVESSNYSQASTFFLLGQWHSVDNGTPRSPPLEFDYGSGQFSISTRSDDDVDGDGNGVEKIRYTASLPTVNTWVNFVAHIVFSQTGTLEVWRNGTKIVDLSSTPIGYYDDVGALAYFQFGVYGTDQSQSLACRYANMEWGLTDLSDRISNPLPIPS